MKLLKNIKPLYLLIALVTAFAAAITFLLLTLQTPSSESDGKSLTQVIPEAETKENSGSKVEGYNRGSLKDHWDSYEEEAPSFSGVQDSKQEAGARPAPATPSVDELFSDNTAKQAKPAKSGGGQTRRSEVKTTKKPEPEVEEQKPAPRPQVRRSGAVSSLDDADGSLGDGFSTLDGSDTWISHEEGRPYRCMFTRDEKVKSGQRITLRLLEDIIVGGTKIPCNTHLQGVCTISERMEIRVSSLDMGGKILSFRLEAYDTDGGKGIYCSDLSKGAKEAVDQSINTVTSSLNSRIGRVARDAATLGASLVRSKTGEATVSIPAGYAFYLVEQTR